MKVVEKKYWCSRDIFKAYTVWTEHPSGKDIFVGPPHTIVHDAAHPTLRVGECVRFTHIELQCVYDVVWISRDPDGHIDIWSQRPQFIRTVYVSAKGQTNINGDIAFKLTGGTSMNSGIINYFDSLPKAGDLWEITLV